MTTATSNSLLQGLRPGTRVVLAALLLGWLLLQVILLMISNLPDMAELGRAATLTIAAGAPIAAWLLVIHFPDADVPPESLQFLLMVAAMGFATATALRWVFRPQAKES